MTLVMLMRFCLALPSSRALTKVSPSWSATSATRTCPSTGSRGGSACADASLAPIVRLFIAMFAALDQMITTTLTLGLGFMTP